MKQFDTIRTVCSLSLAFAGISVVLPAVALPTDDKMGKMDKMAKQDDHAHMTTVFSGVKVNGGTVTHSKAGKSIVLTLSEDFKVPDSPAPHWQVIDSKGNVYLLQRLQIKGDKFNKQITVPTYVKDVAKVQIWCAWAEVILGEASFPSPLK
jgi:hypothetical protein